jgi:hypothetical protein
VAGFGFWYDLAIVKNFRYVAFRMFYKRIVTSPIIPLLVGLPIFRLTMQYVSHPETSSFLIPIAFWSILFLGVMLLRHKYRKIMDNQSLPPQENTKE